MNVFKTLTEQANSQIPYQRTLYLNEDGPESRVQREENKTLV